MDKETKEKGTKDKETKDKESTWKKGKKPKGETTEAPFLGYDHHRFSAYVELEDLLKHLKGFSAQSAEEVKTAWKKAQEEKKKEAKREEKMRALVEDFTKPFLEQLTFVLRYCTDEDDDLKESEFSKLLLSCASLFTFSDDYDRFTNIFHAVFPTLKEHLKSKEKKAKTSKVTDALKLFQRWHDACWDEKSNQPKNFVAARSDLMSSGLKDMGFN
ncbi:hypothetical protein MHU86_1947 [Fragilaria crotonensis]|nr:hypothetical protein MHU86_1947 [Fragilaria crotonensis]